MTTFGGDRPIVGPVLDFQYDTIQGSTLIVGVTGNALAVSTGTVENIIKVLPTGTALTLSRGTVTNAIIPPVTGTLLTLPSGTVTVIAGNTITVGVSGSALALSAGTISLAFIVSVSGRQLDVISGSLVAAGIAFPITEHVITHGPARVRHETVLDVLEEQLGQHENSGTLRSHSRLRDS